MLIRCRGFGIRHTRVCPFARIIAANFTATERIHPFSIEAVATVAVTALTFDGKTKGNIGGNRMSDLVTVVFDNEATAFEMRAALVRMQHEHLISMEDAVVVTKDNGGKIKLHQTLDLTAAGAVSGGFLGMLIGRIFANPAVGAAVGSAVGALSGRFRDIGINDGMMRNLAKAFTPGTSALFVLIKKVAADKVLEGLKSFAGKGKVFKTSLDGDDEAALRAVLEKD